MPSTGARRVARSQTPKRPTEGANCLARRGVPQPDVEDVAFGVRQGRPSRPVLVKVSDLGRAEGDRTLDLGWEVGRYEVKVSDLPLRGSGTARNISAGKVRSSDAGIMA